MNPKYCRMQAYSVLPDAIAHTVQVAGRIATLAAACWAEQGAAVVGTRGVAVNNSFRSFITLSRAEPTEATMNS